MTSGAKAPFSWSAGRGAEAPLFHRMSPLSGFVATCARCASRGGRLRPPLRERVLNLFAVPAVADDFALGHLPEEVGAAAGGVLFFVGGAPTGAHDAAFFAAAFAYSDTTQGGMREAAMIFGELEMCFRLPRCVIWAQAQVFVEPVGLKHFSRIHLPVGIPCLFEFAEGLHQFGAKHF